MLAHNLVEFVEVDNPAVAVDNPVVAVDNPVVVVDNPVAVVDSLAVVVDIGLVATSLQREVDGRTCLHSVRSEHSRNSGPRAVEFPLVAQQHMAKYPHNIDKFVSGHIILLFRYIVGIVRLLFFCCCFFFLIGPSSPQEKLQAAVAVTSLPPPSTRPRNNCT